MCPSVSVNVSLRMWVDNLKGVRIAAEVIKEESAKRIMPGKGRQTDYQVPVQFSIFGPLQGRQRSPESENFLILFKNC